MRSMRFPVDCFTLKGMERAPRLQTGHADRTDSRGGGTISQSRDRLDSRKGGNSRIASARSARLPGGDNSRIAIARSARFQDGGRFPDGARAIGRIPGEDAIPGSRSRDRPDSKAGAFARSPRFPGGGDSRIAIARSAGFQEGGNSRIAIARSAELQAGRQFPDRDRAIGRILRGGVNSRNAIARSVGFQVGAQFPDRDRGSARFRGGEGAVPGPRSRDRPDSKRGAIPGSRSRDQPNSAGGRNNSPIAIARSAGWEGERFPDRDRAIGQIPGGARIAIARSAGFPEGGRNSRAAIGGALPGSRSRDRPNCRGGSNSWIAIARSAGFREGGDSPIATARSAELQGGRRFPDRGRAIGQIEGGGDSRIAIARSARFRGGASQIAIARSAGFRGKMIR